MNKALTKMTFFERLLMRVSPSWGASRFYTRRRVEAAARAFESVELSRLRKSRTDLRSADQINSLATDKLRAQARYLDENHDLARSVLNSMVSQIVGSGLLTFPMPKDKKGEVMIELSDQITNLWDNWGKRPEVTWEHCWPKVQSLLCRSWLRDGEVFAQLIPGIVAGLDHGSKVSFSVELLEADYVPTALNDSNRSVRQGIEKNAWGRPRVYWVFKNYPSELAGELLGGMTNLIGFNIGFNDVKGIVAERMIHLKHTDRIRQTRGVSVFASVFTRLDDLKDYEESERQAARIGAAFALAITKGLDGDLDTPSSAAAFREMDIAPGIIADTLQPGEKIESIKNERPDNKITDFRANQLRAVAGGTNSSYSVISKDFSGSYSSQRQELVEQARITGVLRCEFINVALHPIYKMFIDVAVAQGLLDTAGVDPLSLYDADHVGLGTAYIEPQRESQADVVQVKAGIKSLTRVQLDRGLNPREIHKQLVRERILQNADGLVLSSDAEHDKQAKMGISPAPSPADDEDADDEDADDARGYIIGKKYVDEKSGEIFEYTEKGFEKVA